MKPRAKTKKGRSPGSNRGGHSRLGSCDLLLVEVALDEARNATVNDDKKQKKVDKEIEKAEKELAKAQEELDKGKPDKAIDHYKKAWEHAGHAAKEAAKAPKNNKDDDDDDGDD